MDLKKLYSITCRFAAAEGKKDTLEEKTVLTVLQVEELRKGMVPPLEEPIVKAGIQDGVWVTGWC